MGWFGGNKKKESPLAVQPNKNENARSQMKQLEEMEKQEAAPPPAPPIPGQSRTGTEYNGHLDLQPPRK